MFFFLNKKSRSLQTLSQNRLHKTKIKRWYSRCTQDYLIQPVKRDCRGRDCLVVGFTATCTISVYHHWHDFKSHLWRGVLDTTFCDEVCQWLAKGQWFSPGTLVSSTNKTDHYVITEILLKVALNIITKPNLLIFFFSFHVP